MSSTTARVVIVTGAAQGQGAAEARRFAADGAIVIAADVSAPVDLPGDRPDRTGPIVPGAIVPVRHDVTDPESWRRLVDDVAARFGRLDVLVNNAGISRGLDVRGTTLEDWNAVLAVDLTGAFLGIQACTPLLRESGGGAIVNTGTAAAFNGFYRAAYSAAKWGLRGLTKSAASSSPRSASRSTPSIPGSSTRPWRRSPRCTAGSSRPCPSVGRRRPTRSLTSWSSSPRRRRGRSPAPTCSSTAGSPPPGR